MKAVDVLESEFLQLRAKILELAALLDQMDRGEGSLGDDPRLERLRQGLDILRQDTPNRAERVQMVFSLPYDSAWRKKFGL